MEYYSGPDRQDKFLGSCTLLEDTQYLNVFKMTGYLPGHFGEKGHEINEYPFPDELQNDHNFKVYLCQVDRWSFQLREYNKQ